MLMTEQKRLSRGLVAALFAAAVFAAGLSACGGGVVDGHVGVDGDTTFTVLMVKELPQSHGVLLPAGVIAFAAGPKPGSSMTEVERLQSVGVAAQHAGCAATAGAQYAVLAGVAPAAVHKAKLMGFRVLGGADRADGAGGAGGAPALHAIDCAAQSL